MDWAYRMIAAHDLDPLGGMIVMHLGWRDHPGQRTNSGIARALRQHRKSVQLATAKLVALGVIARRSGQWVAVETIKIVEGAPDAPRPPVDVADEGCEVSTHPPLRSEYAGGCEVSTQGSAKSLRTIEKENKEKGAPVRPPVRQAPPAASPHECGGGGLDEVVKRLSAFQRSRLRIGGSVQIEGVVWLPGSRAYDDLARSVIAADRQ